MIQRTINIYSTGPDPKSCPINPNDQVLFQMVDWPVQVTVDFGSSSPFQDTKFDLGGSNQPLSAQNKTALSDSYGIYSYTVTPTSKEIDPEPTGTVGGDIEVSSNPVPPK